jgi:hypothetical protein
MSIVPNSKPQLKQAEAIKIISKFKLDEYPVKLLGIRGYYKQTMGNPLTNDVGLYDDAIFIIAPQLFGSYNANTDPSVKRTGVAMVKANTVTLYKVGLHNMKAPYEALRQNGNVTVIREGQGEFTDSQNNRFWINIHKGGYNTTSSLGCQTVYPTQWISFMESVKDQLKRNNQKIIPYVLVEY